MKKEIQHIPSGYKPSPIGIIPEDWEVTRISDWGKVITGSTPPTEDEANYGNDYKFVSPADISENKYIQDTEKHLSKKGFALSRPMPKGTVLFTCIGSTIGKCAIVDETLTSNQQINAIICDSKHSGEFLYYELCHRSNKIKQIAGEQAVPIINKSTFENYKIICPPLKEQVIIASILSLWDTAIAKQTSLIEQLTLRKRGLMQQLLTGKKRLKGFEGGTFHRLGNYITECNRRNNGCNRVLSVTNTRGFILQEEQFDKIVASNDTSNYKIVRRGEFAYNPSRVNVGSLAMLNEYDEGILSPMYIVFKANENIDKSYLLQSLQSWWFRGHIPAYTQGSVRDSLSFDGLCSMKFYIPTLQEQKAISAILEQADNEIELANKKLSYLQQQKKGLMQVSLTGKKRINL